MKRLSENHIMRIRTSIEVHRANTLAAIGREEALAIIDELLDLRKGKAVEMLHKLQEQLAVMNALVLRVVNHYRDAHPDPYGACKKCGDLTTR